MNTMFDNTTVAFQSKSKKSLLKAYWLFRLMGWNKLTKIGTYFVKIALKAPLGLKKIIKNTLYQQFCGGENFSDCTQTMDELSLYGLSAIPDYVAEGQEDTAAFEGACAQIMKTIAQAAQDSHISFAVFKVTALGPFEVLAKKQRREAFSPLETIAWEALKKRVDSLMAAAASKGVRILVDAEESWVQDTVDELVWDGMERHNKAKALIYTTCQMYRSDMLGRIEILAERGRQKDFVPGIKLVRGAYLEKENQRAKHLVYKSPMHQCKAETDEAFDEALRFCLHEEMALCIGTHNEASVLYAMMLMKEKQILPSSERVYFAQLYGMSDHISYNLAAQGYRVAKYLPFGPMELSLPYLFRRAQENKSVAGQVSRELALIKKELQRRTKQA
jgi:proline dehydrogenase